MDTKKLIRILKNISYLLEIKGENPFKSKAYTNVADIIAEENIDLEMLLKTNSLAEVKGFGKAMVNKVTEYVDTGKIEYYENLKQVIPESIIELTKIPGLGTKKIKQLFDELKITDLDSLEEACINNSIIEIKGFGVKSSEDILTGIQFVRAFRGRHIQENILKEASMFVEQLRRNPVILKAEFAGDIRRVAETTGALVLVVSASSFALAKGVLREMNYLELEEENYCEIQLNESIRFQIHLVKPDEYIPVFHTLTGSSDYIEGFRSLFASKGYEIINNKICRSGDIITVIDEEKLYELAGVEYIPPILREKRDTAARIADKGLPRLVEPQDIKGIVHVHTNWSDGRHTIKEMALKAAELGFEYIAVTDHSKSSVIANGLQEDRVIQQQKEIDRLNDGKLGIKIIKGIECDILSDGSLDYNEDILKHFELVIVSVHNNFKMKKEEMTNRVIRALKNPYTTMLGHPTGRLLLARQSYEIDIKQVIDAASDYGKIIEINSNPFRLDLNWENAMYASEKKVSMSINPDSHRAETITDVYHGVNVAQKAWLTKENIVNCLDSIEFMDRIISKTI